MRKLSLLIFVLALFFIAACQQAQKSTASKVESTNKVEAPKTGATGNAAVDAVGNDLNSVNSVEKDLNSDQLNDVDSGLSDVQNI